MRTTLEMLIAMMMCASAAGDAAAGENKGNIWEDAIKAFEAAEVQAGVQA